MSEPARAPRVIIGEADRWTSELIGQLVRSARCDAEIVTLKDGESVLQQCRQSAPQLMIVDFGLPGIGGLDLLREVRRQRRQPPLPFFLITEKIDASSVRAAVPLAPTAYLAKPFDADDLLRRLRQVLLEPGEEVVCPLPTLAPEEKLDAYLERTRETSAGAPLLGAVHDTLELLQGATLPDLDDLQRRFHNDPQLTAQLIAAANTAAQHRGGGCQTLAQALQRLGTKHSLNLALGLALQRGASLEDPLLTASGLKVWAQSQRVAELAHWLAARLEADAERCFTAGLLHRLGDLALLRTLQDWHSQGGALDEGSLEKAMARHAAPFGSALRIRWRLPLELRQLVKAVFQLDSGVYTREALVLNLAAQAAQVGADQPFAPLAEHKAARMLRLDAAALEKLPRLTDVR
ncbi:HDOD domain-containing protein [Pseudomonas subflava]|uniref:HDOD domain-containing protein n=1 Tax=Pseudomonas subflava TaxID=2952933 RepID=UPI00207A6DD2|nr:HDOD domain-containing protein [Pseudomonas subflava]